MNDIDIHDINLAAPCGFYCGTCRHYLARTKGLLTEKSLKHGCKGCRVQNKECTWIKRDCALIRKNEITFYFECKEFPCNNLKNLDHRHKQNDQISLIVNLKRIKKVGVQHWLQEQEDEWSCPSCRGAICVMDKQCYDCGHEYK